MVSDLSDGVKAPWITRLGPSGEERFERTRFALHRMGGAILGSAVTTIGCSLFLIACSLRIFQKLGAVVLAVTLLSVVYGLTWLPAILVAKGPLSQGAKQFWKMVGGVKAF